MLVTRSRQPIASPTIKLRRFVVDTARANAASATVINDRTIRMKCFTGNIASATISLASAVAARCVF